MLISPLNLISTPAAVLNTLGLTLRVGLSSEDPMVGRHSSEPYEAFLTSYSPEGLLEDRTHLGRIPANRRRFFDISSITRQNVTELNHLVVVHRVPSRLLPPDSNVEDAIELPSAPDYSFFRSLVEYSFPGGGNGSIIYETPHRLNAGTSSSGTLTFTCQAVLSPTLNTHLVLIHYSVDPSYSKIAAFNFALHSSSGNLVVSERVEVAPFSVAVVDLAKIVPMDVVESYRDPEDGLSAFNLVGYCEESTLLPLFVNTSPSLKAVAIEHTHPPQTYLLPWESNYQRTAKRDALQVWKSPMMADGSK